MRKIHRIFLHFYIAKNGNKQ